MIDRPRFMDGVGGIVNLIHDAWFQTVKQRPLPACLGVRLSDLAEGATENECIGLDAKDIAKPMRCSVVGA